MHDTQKSRVERTVKELSVKKHAANISAYSFQKSLLFCAFANITQVYHVTTLGH